MFILVGCLIILVFGLLFDMVFWKILVSDNNELFVVVIMDFLWVFLGIYCSFGKSFLCEVNICCVVSLVLFGDRSNGVDRFVWIVFLSCFECIFFGVRMVWIFLISDCIFWICFLVLMSIVFLKVFEVCLIFFNEYSMFFLVCISRIICLFLVLVIVYLFDLKFGMWLLFVVWVKCWVGLLLLRLFSIKLLGFNFCIVVVDVVLVLFVVLLILCMVLFVLDIFNDFWMYLIMLIVFWFLWFEYSKLIKCFIVFR